jgi:hypothetical protein
MVVTVFRNLYKSTDTPFYVKLENVIDRIKSGKSKERIEKLRNETDEEARKKIKNALPCILFSGKFTERNKKSCKKHSGLMTIDFDDIPNESEYNRISNELKQNPHLVLFFRSPSGDGIKAVVNIPLCTPDEHYQYFQQFKEQFNYDYLDGGGSDVSRVCFESYDPNIYVAEKYTKFEPKLIDKGFQAKERVPLLPISDENIIIERIMSWSWNKDFTEGQRNEFLFDLAGAFCEYGVNQSTAIGYLMNNVIHGDFSEREAENTIKSAYKRRSFGSQYFEDYELQKKIKLDLKKGKSEVIKKYNISEQTFDEINEVDEHEDFWYYKETKSGVETKIDPLKYKLFLERSGFKKYYQSETSQPIFVKINSNIVKEISTEKIKDFVLNYLMERGEIGVWSLCANYQTLFSSNFLNFLDTIELLMLRDTKDSVFIAFQNGILEVTKKGSKLIDYIDIDGYVWESQIIKKDFIKLQNTDNDYKQFINNVSKNNPLPFECVFGYLVSTYKDKTNNKAVILNDEVITDNPEGGTGKGIFCQGLQQVRRVSILDGKSFDDKKTFAYQTVSPETNILFFDDVKKHFDFEAKFSLVTEGITLERKNKDALKLSVEDSPKILISTNYAIKGSGNSHDRRRHEIEFAQHYGRNNEPFDEFKRQLFADWNESDYNHFYNYAVYCVQQYLINGLVKQDAVNIELRKFIAKTCMEFYDFAKTIELNTNHDKAKVFEAFLEDYPDYKTYKLSRKRFNIWVQDWAIFEGLGYMELNHKKDFQLVDKSIKVETLDNEPPF